jgi:hypothetical protein
MDNRDYQRGGVRINRPEAYEELGEQETGGMPETPAKRKSSKGPWILLLTIVVVLAVLGVVFRDRLGKPKEGKTMQAQYQAVFLTNGQVYFGKLSDVNDRYLKLENIYYLQVTPVLQTKTEGETGTQATQQQQLSLVKLGQELHGPQDSMFVNRDQVLFFEDLKDDGKVVQAIKKYEEDAAKPK